MQMNEMKVAGIESIQVCLLRCLRASAIVQRITIDNVWLKIPIIFQIMLKSSIHNAKAAAKTGMETNILLKTLR